MFISRIHCCYNNRPKRDSHDQPNKQQDDVKGSRASLLDHDDEKSIKLLDEILAKAQTAHDISQSSKVI